MAVLPVSPAIACVRSACRIERVSVMCGHMCLQAEGDAIALHTGCQQRLRGHARMCRAAHATDDRRPVSDEPRCPTTRQCRDGLLLGCSCW